MVAPSIRFEPIAIKLARQVPLHEFLPLTALDEVREVQNEENLAEPLPSHTQHFLAHYHVVTRCSMTLLGAPDFARLERLHGAWEEEYMPGGPPMSPVYDSYLIQHLLAEVPVGIANETPYSVLTRMLARDPQRRAFHELAACLAASHLDLYQVHAAKGLNAELENARTGERFEAHLTGAFLRSGDRVLARVMKFGDHSYICDSPYLLDAPINDWIAYLERATSPTEAAAKPEPSASKSKLTSKQKAKLKAKQRAASPAQDVVRHLKFGESERFWLDYVMDAYLGERNGIVYLAGVPDRPELLPHSEAYDPTLEANQRSRQGTAQDAPVPHRLRQALMAIARDAGLIDRARLTWQSLGSAAIKEPVEQERPLFEAYCALGEFNDEGLTALDLFVSDPRSTDPELAALAADLQRGWFSVFRIDRIELDRSLHVFDVLRRRRLEVSERSATRSVANGSLLMGWVSEDAGGTLRLEGGIFYVPPVLTNATIVMAKTLRDGARRQLRGMEWRKQLAQLPLALILGARVVMQSFHMELLNTSGDELQPATGRYTVVDSAAARAALDQQYEANGNDSWAWVDPSNVVIATFELRGKTLFARVNSLRRLELVKAHLEQTLGSAIKPSLSSIEAPIGTQLELPLASRPRQPKTPPLDLPAEVRPQIQAMLLRQIQSQFDHPMPMFKGKTLRQLARGKKSRADAVSWLREQERLLRTNPQFADIDVRPLWRELGLEYQGLDTD